MQATSWRAANMNALRASRGWTCDAIGAAACMLRVVCPQRPAATAATLPARASGRDCDPAPKTETRPGASIHCNVRTVRTSVKRTPIDRDAAHCMPPRRCRASCWPGWLLHANKGLQLDPHLHACSCTQRGRGWRAACIVRRTRVRLRWREGNRVPPLP